MGGLFEPKAALSLSDIGLRFEKYRGQIDEQTGTSAGD